MTNQPVWDWTLKEASADELVFWNREEGRTHARRFLPYDDAIARIRHARSMGKRRLLAMALHPDERVPTALIRSPHEPWNQGPAHRALLVVALTVRALVSVRDRAETTASPVLDLGGSAPIESRGQDGWTRLADEVSHFIDVVLFANRRPRAGDLRDGELVAELYVCARRRGVISEGLAELVERRGVSLLSRIIRPLSARGDAAFLGSLERRLGDATASWPQDDLLCLGERTASPFFDVTVLRRLEQATLTSPRGLRLATRGLLHPPVDVTQKLEAWAATAESGEGETWALCLLENMVDAWCDLFRSDAGPEAPPPYEAREVHPFFLLRRIGALSQLIERVSSDSVRPPASAATHRAFERLITLLLDPEHRARYPDWNLLPVARGQARRLLLWWGFEGSAISSELWDALWERFFQPRCRASRRYAQDVVSSRAVPVRYRVAAFELHSRSRTMLARAARDPALASLPQLKDRILRSVDSKVLFNSVAGLTDRDLQRQFRRMVETKRDTAADRVRAGLEEGVASALEPGDLAPLLGDEDPRVRERALEAMGSVSGGASE